MSDGAGLTGMTLPIGEGRDAGGGETGLEGSPTDVPVLFDSMGDGNDTGGGEAGLDGWVAPLDVLDSMGDGSVTGGIDVLGCDVPSPSSPEGPLYTLPGLIVT